LTISQPAQIDILQMSVHLAHPAGRNVAATGAGTGTGLGGKQAERFIFIEIWKKGRTYGKK